MVSLKVPEHCVTAPVALLHLDLSILEYVSHSAFHEMAINVKIEEQ